MDGGDGGGVVEVAVVVVVAVALAVEVAVVAENRWKDRAIDPTALHRCVSSCSATIKPHPIFMTELCAK